MYEHHKRALDNLVEVLKPDPSILAVITAGSIAQGKAKETSDIDVYLVVDDETYMEKRKNHNLSYINKDQEICDYPDGYVDGKIINLRFLELAAERGSEPTRASFIGSEAWFTRIPDLDMLLAKIPVYPEQNRDKNMADFYAEILLNGFYFSNEALKKNNPYLLSQAVSSLVLYGGRIILAHNRMLFPCHKSLMAAVENAKVKPDNFIEHAFSLLKDPTEEKCRNFSMMMLGFHRPGITPEQATTIFMENNEWNWIDQAPPLSDR
ncbi:nucleotidyltransferase domain-containing protein [Paenibacillus prosopidis]|uniref:Putative nucleotidyltransferase n=1 Tax=Paenibacillus prosopidis TaxID=630520 RepID=A0A368VPM7_9BACL|nr:nucleotidyltransferase domain-containing protein [Paenibacillus prosopidis]RCW43480.1 putative nucleotidyltransferase [Paenibacillus prosopidis]